MKSSAQGGVQCTSGCCLARHGGRARAGYGPNGALLYAIGKVGCCWCTQRHASNTCSSSKQGVARLPARMTCAAPRQREAGAYTQRRRRCTHCCAPCKRADQRLLSCWEPWGLGVARGRGHGSQCACQACAGSCTRQRRRAADNRWCARRLTHQKRLQLRRRQAGNVNERGGGLHVHGRLCRASVGAGDGGAARHRGG